MSEHDGEKTWRLLEEADRLPAGDQRSALLNKAIAELGAYRADLPEMYAVALAMSALDEPERLPAAIAACNEGDEQDAAMTFAFAHLAEALLSAGRFEEALRTSNRVDAARFDGDLHWRALRIDEIRAASLVRLGRIAEAELTMQRLFRELANEGDYEMLPAPTEVVEALLDAAASGDAATRERAQSVIRRLVDSLDIDQWFPKDTAESIRRAVVA
jgi:tetratricopeptide (TPR) repeat protein